jgi:hypothetical protein
MYPVDPAILILLVIAVALIFGAWNLKWLWRSRRLTQLDA